MNAITEIITNLSAEQKQLKERSMLIQETIEHLQSVCNHTNTDGTTAFVNNGNDSHYDYQQCAICKKTERI